MVLGDDVTSRHWEALALAAIAGFATGVGFWSYGEVWAIYVYAGMCAYGVLR